MISLTNLSKKFGRQMVVRNVTVDFPEGRCIALVGPNGSGKSTLLKCILGLVNATSGALEVGGQQVNGQCDYRKMIGYMPQYARFPENLKVREVIQLVKDVRGDNGAIEHDLLERLALEQEIEKRVYTLSGGMRQKLSSVLAFMFSPQYLILDEPTASLDPRTSRALKKMIKERVESGATVIVSSHIMSEIEEIADDVVFLLDGVLEYSGSIAELRKKTNTGRLEEAIAVLMSGEN